MDEALQSLIGFGFAGAPFVIAFAAALIWFAAVVVVPRPLLLLVVCVTAAFPPGSSVEKGGAFAFDAYGKGGGYFFFSLLEITLLLLAVGAALRRAGGGNPLGKYYWMMFVVLLWHVMVGMIDGDAPWLSNLSRAGMFYLFLQGLLVYSMVSYVATREDLNRLVSLLALTIGARMLWGGFRYAFLGGDPMSAYEDATGSGGSLRMTFWDINDSIYACLLGGMLVWVAAVADDRPRWQRLAALLFALYCFAIVALSARRTAQGGAILALVLLVFLLPKGRRWPVLVVFALSVPLALYKFQARMGTDGSLLERVFAGEQRQRFYVDSRYERFYELRTAWRTIEQYPLLGVGPAGEFEVSDDVGLGYHKGNYGFVHSGFVHILLKAGAIGLLIFCGLLAAYLRALARGWPGASNWDRAVLAASACGFAASVPNLVFGTPLIEARTMLVMGVVMALPLVTARVNASAASNAPVPFSHQAGTGAARV